MAREYFAMAVSKSRALYAAFPASFSASAARRAAATSSSPSGSSGCGAGAGAEPGRELASGGGAAPEADAGAASSCIWYRGGKGGQTPRASSMDTGSACDPRLRLPGPAPKSLTSMGSGPNPAWAEVEVADPSSALPKLSPSPTWSACCSLLSVK
ncbi:hypothetical protein F751_4611 [Auxenochlorella protothecoides]|uniref:Uncharacterized protein n=1 Tax=Auxenochlorella protothecoides TaxID=3075 RepID=A0A087SNN7_AUXPR|nr:hypothetical protein F751_4611 [Auxenochlorella protothecoides]KFM27341.1 hypothetical protein F751_4611 [Auxenochlorella protothecoides]